MKPFFGLLLALQLGVTATALAASEEFDLAFTAKDIQAVVDKAPRSKALINGLILVSLEESPVIKLGDSPNRFGISARLAIQLAGAKPVPARISGSASIVYDESRKAFFLRSPRVETLDAAFIPKALEDAAKGVITDQLAQRFGATPLYTLRADRSMKERTAWQSLKSIQIRKDEVLAKYAMH